ncbi:hypothetical protein FOXG_15046 [Fusarium oxysporum f. sp. lycopersici 4287]|uniref:MHYT domain-containing protein n=2 Tax=Fusarium oxysporum TaxID=5507 RepID=A0A0J9W3R7_FUSO4|nr:hypothetical protein FOXG_15046 [Fusarium oxysporum f. sp. lycopersici 4287]KNB17540.1 hypothetical protein FOXG_15046 [Fusarium oxysporum f. sp. lycopersici 4287]
MTAQNLLREYQGHIVPQSYNAGFVALSFVVSLVGAGSTLELINRRTGLRGLYNHLLLMSSAVTMGGVSIWCMHFIGNRAIDLADGEPDMQVAYSSGFTAVSFFVPILVLLAAFVAVGTNNSVSWWRLITGGVLCGTAVCGMHYLGNASIDNYTCVYRPAYVVSSAIIAIVASNVALAMFFVFRAMWANSWWKRVISAVVLAGAVSGMHWCAASLSACFIIAISAILRARNMRRSALRAQQITLGAAIFDKAGRILVDPDGLIPSTVVTDSFLEKLVSDHGEMIESYDMIFRELFCLAAAALADRLRNDLTSIGVLWDEILPTGANVRRPRAQQQKPDRGGFVPEAIETGDDKHDSLNMAEKGINVRQQDYGRGSLMFLISHTDSERDAERFVSAGYRFAELHQVSEIIRSSMHIKSHEFETKLRDMSTYTSDQNHLLPGVHLGFFAIRARVSSGFEVLARKDRREGFQDSTIGLSSKMWPFGRSDTLVGARRKAKSVSAALSGRRLPSPDSARSMSNSTINLCPPGSVNRTRSLDSTDDSGAYPAQDELPQATPSYGGIMVFQEITIDVEEGKETVRAQNNGTETSNTVVLEKTNSKSWPGAGIELQTMGHFGTNVQAGARVSKDIETHRGTSSHVASFIDVLFSETVESR